MAEGLRKWNPPCGYCKGGQGRGGKLAAASLARTFSPLQLLCSIMFA